MRHDWTIAAALLSIAVSSCAAPEWTDAQEIESASATLSAQTAASKLRHGWPLAGFDIAATAHNRYEHCIGRGNVEDLHVEWVFDDGVADRPVRAMHATPVVDREGNVYIGDFYGNFFSISAQGEQRWAFSADAPTPELAALFGSASGGPPSAPFVGAAALAEHKPYVVVADTNGRVYARDRRTGAEVWTARDLETNPLGGVAGNSLSIVGETVLIGMSSLENYAFVLSDAGLRVDCCAHQGSVIALDLTTGRVRWRHDNVDPALSLPPSQAPFLLGPSGADVWSQPTYDPESNTVFVSTGQNLSPDSQGNSTGTSDAIIAIDATRGTRRWVHQFTSGDIWAVGVANPNPVTGQPVDMDLGDAPKIYRLRGRTVVGAGQKDGRYHVLDARTGALINTAHVIDPRNDLGGFQTGGAYAYDTAFQHGLAATDGFSDCKEGTCPYEGYDGRVVALSGDGSKVLWSVSIPASPLVGGLAVANRLVYFQSPVEEEVPLTDPPRWGLYAVDAKRGDVRKRMTFSGRAIGTPVVADGHVYVTAGNLALTAWGQVPEGSLMRLGVYSCAAED